MIEVYDQVFIGEAEGNLITSWGEENNTTHDSEPVNKLGENEQFQFNSDISVKYPPEIP